LTIEAVFFDIGDTLLSDRPSLEDRIWAASLECGIVFDRARLTPALRCVEDYALARYTEGRTQDDPTVMSETALRLLDELGFFRPNLATRSAARTGRPNVSPGHRPGSGGPNKPGGRSPAPTGQPNVSPGHRPGSRGPEEQIVESLVASFLAQPFVRELHPDALTTIDRLKARGFLIGVVSDWDASLGDLLASLGLLPKLDALAVSETVGCAKPCRRLFEEALGQANVVAAASVHIGDFYELDVVGARSAGMHTLLFDWRGRVTDADCPRATTFAQIVEYLDALPSPG